MSSCLTFLDDARTIAPESWPLSSIQCFDRQVKEIQAEAEHRIARDIEAEYARQRVAAELAERLKELKNSNNQSNMQGWMLSLLLLRCGLISYHDAVPRTIKVLFVESRWFLV